MNDNDSTLDVFQKRIRTIILACRCVQKHSVDDHCIEQPCFDSLIFQKAIKMVKTLPASIVNPIFLVLFMIPRQLGLSSASCNLKTRDVQKSQFWRIYSIICACAFTVVYPFAIIKILESLESTSDAKVFVIIDITNYFATYLFCVTIYLRVLVSSTELLALNNSCVNMFLECRHLCEDKREIGFFLLFATRVLYLYLGNTTLNAVTLIHHSQELEDVPFVYKCLYFVPDLVWATTMIRLRSAITMFVFCLKQINQACSKCIYPLALSDDEPANEQFRHFAHAKHTFDKITDCHSRLFDLVRKTDSIAGNILIFSILKAFAHLSSTVNFHAFCLEF